MPTSKLDKDPRKDQTSKNHPKRKQDFVSMEKEQMKAIATEEKRNNHSKSGNKKDT